MIITRYLLREILGPFAIVLSVLSVLFTSFGAASFLSDAVNGLLPTDTIVQVIGLRTLIALEMLIPISLYLSVVMALGRLYVDSEITALFALGLTPARVMGIVLGLSLCTALVVAGLSLVVRPWDRSGGPGPRRVRAIEAPRRRHSHHLCEVCRADAARWRGLADASD